MLYIEGFKSKIGCVFCGLDQIEVAEMQCRETRPRCDIKGSFV